MSIIIFGERCSGTNFLKHSLIENFNIEINDENKHYFNINEKTFLNDSKNYYIGIVRDPYEFVNSLFKNPHNLPNSLSESTQSFLNNEFYSLGGFKKYDIYKNIYELIKIKYNYLKFEMPLKVKNYIFIKYEDLNDNYENTLNLIKNKFDLIRTNENYIKIKLYKGFYLSKFVKSKNYVIDKNEFDANNLIDYNTF